MGLGCTMDGQTVGFQAESRSDRASPLPAWFCILSNEKKQGGRRIACEGFRIGKKVAIGYLKGGIAKIGREFQIRVLGEDCKATVVPTPFYDPENIRLKS